MNKLPLLCTQTSSREHKAFRAAHRYQVDSPNCWACGSWAPGGFASPTASPCSAIATLLGIQSTNKEDLRALALVTADRTSWETLKNSVWGWNFISGGHPGQFHCWVVAFPIAHPPSWLGCSSSISLLLFVARHVSSSYSLEGPTSNTLQQLSFISHLCYNSLCSLCPRCPWGCLNFPSED